MIFKKHYKEKIFEAYRDYLAYAAQSATFPHFSVFCPRCVDIIEDTDGWIDNKGFEGLTAMDRKSECPLCGSKFKGSFKVIVPIEDISNND